jgi:hypothetical protein
MPILTEYNYNNKLPFYGFGSVVNHPNYNSKGKVSHFFPINMNTTNACLNDCSKIFE